MACVTVLPLLVACFHCTFGIQREIGFLLPHTYLEQTQAAVSSLGSDWKLVLSPNNITSAHNKEQHVAALYSILNNNHKLVGLIGPGTSPVAQLMSPLTAMYGLPILSPAATASVLSDKELYPFFSRTVPPDSYQATVILDLLAKFEWTRIGVLFSNDVYSTGLANVILQTRHLTIQYAALLPGTATHNLTKTLSEMRNEGIRVVVVVSGFPVVENLIWQAEEFGLLTQNIWIVTDTVTNKLMFATYNTTATGAQAAQLRRKAMGILGIAQGEVAFDAFIRDTVQAISVAASQVPSTYDPAACVPSGNDIVPWSDGHKMMDLFRTTSFTGQTGNVEFHTETLDRKRIPYSVYNLQPDGTVDAKWVHVGSWNSSGLQLDNYHPIHWPDGSTSLEGHPTDVASLKGHHLRFVYKVDEPFVIRDESTGTLSGLLIDLLEQFHERGEFTYSLYENIEAGWQDLVEMVGKGKNYDVFLGASYITSAREDICDLTQPFMVDNLSFIMKIPERKENMWGFLDPFSLQLWLLIIFSVTFCGLTYWLLERHHNPYIPNETLKGISTSMWFSFTATLAVNDSAPVTKAGRLFTSGVYWVGVIVIAAYTANLAAFLSKDTATWPINEPKDLHDGSAHVRFDEVGVQQGTVFEDWWKIEFPNMDACWIDRAAFPDDLTGVLMGPNKAVQGCSPKVVIASKAILSYQAVHRKECTLAFRASFHPTGLGFALPHGSSYTPAFNAIILELQEEGWIKKRIAHHWTGPCQSTITGGIKANLIELGVTSMSGIFIVLGGIAVVAAVVHLVELFCLSKRQEETKDQTPEAINRDTVDKLDNLDKLESIEQNGHIDPSIILTRLNEVTSELHSLKRAVRSTRKRHQPGDDSPRIEQYVQHTQHPPPHYYYSAPPPPAYFAHQHQQFAPSVPVKEHSHRWFPTTSSKDGKSSKSK